MAGYTIWYPDGEKIEAKSLESVFKKASGAEEKIRHLFDNRESLEIDSMLIEIRPE